MVHYIPQLTAGEGNCACRSLLNQFWEQHLRPGITVQLRQELLYGGRAIDLQ